MRAWTRAATLVFVAAVVASGCRNPFGRQYEYEEQVYLSVSGAVTVVIDASIPALVALRHLPLDPSIGARVDRDEIRSLYESSGCKSVRVGQPWVRDGRHFVQVTLAADHVAELTKCGPLAWSTYRLTRQNDELLYEQDVAASERPVVPDKSWTGAELVAFKVHAPSRITYHNVRRLDTDETGDPDRGNILTWEQHLEDRVAGRPLRLEVRMQAESILYRTLWLFAGAFGTAIVTIAGVVWYTVRRGRKRSLDALGGRPLDKFSARS